MTNSTKHLVNQPIIFVEQFLNRVRSIARSQLAIKSNLYLPLTKMTLPKRPSPHIIDKLIDECNQIEVAIQKFIRVCCKHNIDDPRQMLRLYDYMRAMEQRMIAYFRQLLMRDTWLGKLGVYDIAIPRIPKLDQQRFDI